ncbi:MAG: DUF1800 family protein [Cryomorphaceae bacterium]
MTRLIAIAVFLSTAALPLGIKAQAPVYDDYIGAGHADGITVSTSSDLEQSGWARNATGQRTVDGGGLDADRMEASRFFAQAGLGGTAEEIENLAKTLDFEGWIDWQLSLDSYSMVKRSIDAWERSKEFSQASGQTPDDFHFHHFQAALWQAAVEEDDVLRQRIALALSEIFVISTQSNLAGTAEAFSAYHDILRESVDGNFRDLLLDISLHPAMGVYLSHFRNEKTNSETNTFPDENFAREIMQLFTIGLYELNTDGSYKTDTDGAPLPSYTPSDVRELSKVFTGLAAGALNEAGIQNGMQLAWHTGRAFTDFTVPMAMHEDRHETGSKQLLGQTIPGGDGMADVEAAIDILFNHPNTGPFFAKHMIRQLVTSNPSSAYISDVAAVFNQNEEGVRGDIPSVVKAVLLHEEARDCLWLNSPSNGKMRPSSLRSMHMKRVLEKDEDYAAPWSNYRRFYMGTLHAPYMSPSVFNFYLPDHRPNGPLGEQSLEAPEFEIHNSLTSIAFANEIDNDTRRDRLFDSPLLNAPRAIAYESYTETTVDPELLINKFDVLLTHGRLSEETRNIIREALTDYTPNSSADIAKDRLDLAVFLIMISPDYNILK